MPTPPPEDSRPQPPSPDAPGTPLRAVLTGLAIDWCGSQVVGIVLATLATAGLSDEQARAALEQMSPQSTYALLGMALGLLCSVAGGYACARIAQRNELRIGGVMVAISGMLALMLGSGQGSDDLTLLSAACTVACELLGVKYGRDHNRRLARPADPPADTPLP